MMETPAQMTTVVLNSPSGPYQGSYVAELREQVAMPTLSVGVLNPIYNPAGVNIYWSTTGSAKPGQYAFSCPAGCLMVLPVSAQVIEVGADPAVLLTNQAVVFVFRYYTVQPAFLGIG